MIFEIQDIYTNDEGDYKETVIVTTVPQNAWCALDKELRRTIFDNRPDAIVLRYWYGDGRMRSQYTIDVKKRRAWLYDGEPTPTILKGIEHYLNLEA